MLACLIGLSVMLLISATLVYYVLLCWPLRLRGHACSLTVRGVDSSGELELVVEVEGDAFGVGGVVFISEDGWRAMGNRAGWR